LKIGFLKSLMRARYAIEPLGHYGLSKANYTHFTSPIRRYADLLVHRALFDRAGAAPATLKEIALHISDTERNSADAERDSKDVKLFAFLKSQLKSGRRESYPALVTDARNFGFFVDVPGLGMSGLVPLSSIQDDFFLFDPARGHLIGRRTRRVIKLGDRLTVRVYKVDTFKKQVDFQLVPSGPAHAAHPAAPSVPSVRHAGRPVETAQPIHPPRLMETPRSRSGGRGQTGYARGGRRIGRRRRPGLSGG
jgi:ribonuclease R